MQRDRTQPPLPRHACKRLPIGRVGLICQWGCLERATVFLKDAQLELFSHIRQKYVLTRLAGCHFGPQLALPAAA